VHGKCSCYVVMMDRWRQNIYVRRGDCIKTEGVEMEGFRRVEKSRDCSNDLISWRFEAFKLGDKSRIKYSRLMLPCGLI